MGPDIKECDKDCALSVHAQVMCILRVFTFMSLHLLLMWVCLMLVLSARVVVHAVVIAFP